MLAAENAFRQALAAGDVREEEVEYVVGTGYGRYKVTFGNTQVTEISCHGRGAVQMFPHTRTVVDMGGQDTKAIRVSPQRRDRRLLHERQVRGRHRPVPGRGLGGARASRSTSSARRRCAGERPVKISTTCTVFAESEVLSWLGKGKKIEDILLGVHQSIAMRSAALLRRVGIEEEVTFTGGVARNVAMIEALNEQARARAST